MKSPVARGVITLIVLTMIRCGTCEASPPASPPIQSSSEDHAAEQEDGIPTPPVAAVATTREANALLPIEQPQGQRLPVAILEFENTSGEPRLESLERALQSFLTTDLAASPAIALVERARLHEIRKELNLAKEGYIDPKTAARMGKGVGAKAILTGSIFAKGGKLRIDARLIHVQSGKVILTAEMTGKDTEIGTLEKQLARQILDTIGIRLSEFQKAELETPHTRSLIAMAGYGRALDHEEVGKWEDARRDVEAALTEDPDFELARALKNQIDQLLSKLREEDFLRKADALATFEDLLLDWPLYGPTFKLDEYKRLWDEGKTKQALFHWVVYHLGRRSTPLGNGDPVSLLFPTPLEMDIGAPSRGMVDLYLELGGAEAVFFWCDVMGADPRFTPSGPLTERMIHPNVLTQPARGPVPSRFLELYPIVLFQQYRAEAFCLGDFARALATLNEMDRIGHNVVNPDVYRRHLEVIQTTVSSPQLLREGRYEAAQTQRLWTLAEERIIRTLAGFQNEQYSAESTDVQASAAENTALNSQVVDELPELRTPIGGGEDKARERLATLLEMSSNSPRSQLRGELRQLAAHACSQPWPNRKINQAVLRAWAHVATDEDLPALKLLLTESPYWDVRIHAASAIGCIRGAAAAGILESAADKEPFYFVRHAIMAALIRARSAPARSSTGERRESF